jgi:outer membrane receptor for ferrienterochelin and colicin
MRSRLFVLALSLLLPLSGRLAAQGATTGAIRGEVTAAAGGAAVSGATVSAVNTATGFRRSAVTDSRGRYIIPQLPAGSYRVEARGLGLGQSTQTGVSVRTNESTSIAFSLTAQAVAVEGLTVTAAPAGADVAQGGVARRVGEEQLENLPVQGRDFTDFLNLSPLVSPQPQVGTGGQFSIAGARTSGTNIQVDGADANNIFFGENRGSSRTPFTFSLESVKEFQLIANGYDVEYGNYQGGVMNAVTKGGTNAWEGSAFFYRRGEALTGDDFFGNPPADYQANQFGVSLGGPIIRDRLHFFVSADGQRRDQPFFAATPEVSGFAADTIARFKQILANTYGVDTAAYFGQYEQAQDNLALFGRLDWTINDQHRLTLRQNFTDFEQTNDRVGTREALTSGGPFKDRVYSTVAELNSDFGGSLFNTFRFQFSDEDRPREANPNGGYLPAFNVTVRGGSLAFGGDGVLFRNRLTEQKLQLVDNLTMRRGAHTIKLGTNNIFSTTENTFWLNGNGAFSFPSLTAFENQAPNRYSRSLRACAAPLVNNEAGQAVLCPEYDVPVASFGVWEGSLYAQDEWEATDRLRVIAGLRYDRTSFSEQPDAVPTVETAFGVETGVVPDFSGISPRLSFTYNLGADQDQLIRGGVGLLIARAPAVLAGNVFQTEKVFRALTCTGATIPDVNMPELLEGAQGQNNPAACAGAGAQAAPEFAVFSDDFELPSTVKLNLGYEGVLPTGTRLTLDGLYSTTRNNFTVQDLNLRDQASFTLAGEGNRPVFIPAARLNSANNLRGAVQSDRAENTGFDRVYLNGSEGEARSFHVSLELQQRLMEVVHLTLSYGYTRASDNGSFSCCTSFEGISNAPTAGNPNAYGDPGDTELGWGPSDFERRHAVVASFLYRAPLGIRLNGIFRAQSGTPWTPVVDGDVNGDGLSSNDRVFVGSNLQFTNAAERDQYLAALEAFDCVAEQEGGFARRNSCRNPWFRSLDLRLAKDIRTFGTQRAEVIVDLFNVLNGLNRDWGRSVTVSGDATRLLRAESYDAVTGNIVYSTNYSPDAEPDQRGFGTARPLTFGDPQQFQVQLGLRYRL